MSFSFGQSYTPFPDSNAVWVDHSYFFEIGYPGWLDPQYLYWIGNYCVNGEDTVIGTEIYTQVKICGGDYFGALRDNGGQVFYVPKDSTLEFILYDFTLEVGDSIAYPIGTWQPFYDTLVVHAVDSILISGEYRTRIEFQNIPDRWIEGIGCTAGLFIEPYANNNVSGGLSEMFCFSYKDTIYVHHSYAGNYGTGVCALQYATVDKIDQTYSISGYPNPTFGSFFIKRDFNASFESIVVTNSLGQMVTPEIILSDYDLEIDLSKFPTGIYFVTLTNEDGKFTQKIFKQ
ncbi:MAG: T9SS type A sorting domain-containing protein [Crocinitomicaceae bacterium]|nr:T9SS type A sorting domain-containing protein [Crocinitomicaceae bacterium]